MRRARTAAGRVARASARPWAAAVAVAVAAAPAAHAEPPDESRWPMLGGSADRAGVAEAFGPASLTPAWSRSIDGLGRLITFVGPSAVVCSDSTVFAIGSITVSAQKQYSLYAIDRGTGALRWSASVASPSADSWSAPVLYGSSVITTTGKKVAAFDAVTGSPRWTATLGRTIVNASAVVTTDLGVRNRLFITQFDGFGEDGLLTCINVDPRLGIANPFDPGQVLWSAPVGGSSGNTPAYCGGVVYCSSIGSPYVAGQVQAFDATATAEPGALWTTVTPEQSFYGGVSVLANGDGLWLYAASYTFDGGVEASRLYKFNALDGSIVWTTPCNRTASTPVLLGDGRVVVSGGIWGFGTVPSIEIFVDEGSTVYRAWHSALDTWSDDGDELLEQGEFFAVGGWNHIPVATASGRWLLGGVPATSGGIGSAYSDLYRLDLELVPPRGTLDGPLDRSFVASQTSMGGGSPAVADGNAYSIGSAGLSSYGTVAAACDISGDGAVDIEDLYWWEQGRGERDVDHSGTVTAADRTLLEWHLRRGESRSDRR